jgi:hypothetical protein
MPTTSLSGWAFHNYGPLTTTFTAPPACFTEARNVQLGSYVEYENSSMSLTILAGTCGTASTKASTEYCFPSEAKTDWVYATFDTRNPAGVTTIDYFSPGIICPSGYATVGLTTKASGGSVTSSGAAFVPTSSVFTSGSPLAFFRNPRPNILLQALSEEETAVLCCPRYVVPEA